jgi:hypothetical protein
LRAIHSSPATAGSQRFPSLSFSNFSRSHGC